MPSVEGNYSINDLTERAFAASIRPKQSDDFTGLNVQVRIGKRNDAPIALNHVAG